MPLGKSEIETIQRKKPVFSHLTFPSLGSVRYSVLQLSVEVFYTKIIHSAHYGNAHFVPLARLHILRSELTD